MVMLKYFPSISIFTSYEFNGSFYMFILLTQNDPLAQQQHTIKIESDLKINVLIHRRV